MLLNVIVVHIRVFLFWLFLKSEHIWLWPISILFCPCQDLCKLIRRGWSSMAPNLFDCIPQVERFASAPIGEEAPHALTMASNHLAAWAGIFSGLAPNYEVIVFVCFWYQ